MQAHSGAGATLADDADMPADFSVFSVNTQCVETLRTSFDVPAVMPPCPAGGCVCAWFWQGQNSDDEMYMNGFRCDVEGASVAATLATPEPAKYCPTGGCVTAAKQPLYWANDASNIAFSGLYTQKPAYDASWGYSNGAQVIAVGGGGSPAPAPAPVPAPATSATVIKPSPVPVQPSSAAAGKPNATVTKAVTMATVTRTWTATATGKANGGAAIAACNWEGHCEGAVCGDKHDCDGEMVCNDGKCGATGLFERYT